MVQSLPQSPLHRAPRCCHRLYYGECGVLHQRLGETIVAAAEDLAIGRFLHTSAGGFLDLYIGTWKGRLYVIDGYGDDGVIERMTAFLLGQGAALGKDASDMQVVHISNNNIGLAPSADFMVFQGEVAVSDAAAQQCGVP